MTYTELLNLFGLPAAASTRDAIRVALTDEIEREREGEGGEEMLRLLSVQLFSLGVAEDCLLIWHAKQASFDASCMVDVQFLCGAGLDATKAFLNGCQDEQAPEALEYIAKCERARNFDDWSPSKWVEYHRRYYHL